MQFSVGYQLRDDAKFVERIAACRERVREVYFAWADFDYGPFIRYCFILTDMELPAMPLVTESLCDHCGECIKACPGHAIGEDGTLDPWRCAVYNNGANGTKNPFMPPEAFSEFEDRLDIICGTAEINRGKAKEILNNIYFYPPAKHFSGPLFAEEPATEPATSIWKRRAC